MGTTSVTMRAGVMSIPEEAETNHRVTKVFRRATRNFQILDLHQHRHLPNFLPHNRHLPNDQQLNR
jgi:hypothetical protein